jgi:hypothetical protein
LGQPVEPAKPLLVGEQNPYGSDDYYALWPDPKGCAGWRLCHRILGLETRKYLRTFDRTNLCDGPWTLDEARAKATRIAGKRQGPLILLGAKVCQAFNLPFAPFSVQTSFLGPDRAIYMLPHPSGRCRTWNEAGSVEKARDLLKEFLR